MALFSRKTRRKAESTGGRKPIGVFTCGGMSFPIPREQLARTEFLTRGKRRNPAAFDEAVRGFEAEVAALTGGGPLDVASWSGSGSLSRQARVKASMAVLMSFGVTAWPVSPEEEATARALADPVEESPAPL
jgi:hypothetical protein